jgi:hypothetical protein
LAEFLAFQMPGGQTHGLVAALAAAFSGEVATINGPFGAKSILCHPRGPLRGLLRFPTYPSRRRRDGNSAARRWRFLGHSHAG